MQPLVIDFLCLGKNEDIICVNKDSWNVTKQFNLKMLGRTANAKGYLLKQKRPNGARKVVRSLDSDDNGTCKNPLLVSNMLNILRINIIMMTHNAC
jgi:hypothetical protein